MLKDLPGLDGTTIVWKGFLAQNLITLFVWLVLIVAYIFTVKKFKFESVIKVSSKIALVVFIMLLVSSVSTMLTTKKMFRKKYPIIVTDKNYANFSSDKNFIIFLVDAVDSRSFDKELQKSKYIDSFKDFTYYPDTMSLYLFTRESVPLILTGVPNYNEDEYYTYYNKAFDKSPLFDELSNKGYDVNIYDHELIWGTEKGRIVKNTNVVSSSMSIFHFFKCNLKYVGYKYLPYNLKKYAKIEKMNFNYGKKTDYDNFYSWDNIDNYKMIKNANVTIDTTKQFKFIHTNGSHVPYTMDGELNRVSEKKATYQSEINASIKLLDSYINLLKENNIYDNSVIIILADHGYANGDRIGRQNPILYIKGINETHKQTVVSDKKVSQTDLMDAYKLLLDDKSSKDLFKNIPVDRVRTFIEYRFTKENHMTEYKLDGHAWESEKAVKTGREFNR
jgi:hypothetical protein